jgi:hypothetical protein
MSGLYLSALVSLAGAIESKNTRAQRGLIYSPGCTRATRRLKSKYFRLRSRIVLVTMAPAKLTAAKLLLIYIEK